MPRGPCCCPVRSHKDEYMTIAALDLGTGKKVWWRDRLKVFDNYTPSDLNFYSLAMTVDDDFVYEGGKHALFSGNSYETIAVWDKHSGQLVRTIELAPIPYVSSDYDFTNFMQTTPSGRLVATTGAAETTQANRIYPGYTATLIHWIDNSTVTTLDSCSFAISNNKAGIEVTSDTQIKGIGGFDGNPYTTSTGGDEFRTHTEGAGHTTSGSYTAPSYSRGTVWDIPDLTETSTVNRGQPFCQLYSSPDKTYYVIQVCDVLDSKQGIYVCDNTQTLIHEPTSGGPPLAEASYQGLAITNSGDLYCKGSLNTVSKFAIDGTRTWKSSSVQGHFNAIRVDDANEYVYLSTLNSINDGKIYKLDASDGSVVWEQQYGAFIDNSITNGAMTMHLDDDMLYVCGDRVEPF